MSNYRLASQGKINNKNRVMFILVYFYIHVQICLLWSSILININNIHILTRDIKNNKKEIETKTEEERTVTQCTKNGRKKQTEIRRGIKCQTNRHNLTRNIKNQRKRKGDRHKLKGNQEGRMGRGIQKNIFRKKGQSSIE